MAKVQIKSEKLTLLEAFFQSWSNLTQFLETEKYDAKPTYKKFLGYRPGVYVIGDILSMSRTAMATQMCAFVRQRLTRGSLPYWNPKASV